MTQNGNDNTKFGSIFRDQGPIGAAPYEGAGRVVKEEEMKRFYPPKTKVLVLYTGGTIGMTQDEEGVLVTESGTICDYMKKYYAYVEKEKEEDWGEEFNEDGVGLFLTRSLNASFQLIEYKNLLDSSCMTPKGWNQMMKTVFDFSKFYDSFVILHGTDTMAYSSSALSFGFRNLRKLVILTGSQIPLSDKGRNDGIDNLLSSLWIAGHEIYSRKIPEVCLCFNRKLFRGSRVTKISADRFNAFDSRNYPILVKLGVHAKVRWNCVRPQPLDNSDFDYIPYYVPKNENDKEFAILHLYPGINKQIVNMLKGDDYHGILVLTFGAGNYSEKIDQFFSEMKKKNKVILVNITQCSTGKVECLYAVCGKSAVPGSDMTVEAAYCKMIHLFSYGVSNEFVEENIQKDLRGELSEKNWNQFDALHYRGHQSERRNDEKMFK